MVYINGISFSCSQVCGLAEMQLTMAGLRWAWLHVTSLLWASFLCLILEWALLGAWSIRGGGKNTKGQLKPCKHI